MSEKATKVPDNHVLAVLPGTALTATLRELEREGFSESTVFHGETMAQEVDAKGEKSGPIEKLFKAVGDHLSEEQNYLAQYEEEARAGNEVLAVHVKDRDEAEAAKQILERHTAHNIRFFGKLAVTDLTPLSNPSTRSDASPEADNWSKQ